MRSKEEEKIENEKQILKQVKGLQKSYETYQVDAAEEEMSFIDRVNKLIQSVMGDSSLSIYEALNEKKLEEWHKRRLTRWIKRINIKSLLYFTFLATITGFLVSEALSFYAIDGVVSSNTWLKAILTEISFIFLSGYRTIGRLQTVWVNFLRVCVFSLMLFVISSQTLSIGTNIIAENQSIKEQVIFLEKQIDQKEKEIVYFRDDRNWPKNTARTTIEKNKLIGKLIVLKDAQISGKNTSMSKIEQYKMYGRAVFRTLLLFISVLITRRIFTF